MFATDTETMPTDLQSDTICKEEFIVERLVEFYCLDKFFNLSNFLTKKLLLPFLSAYICK